MTSLLKWIYRNRRKWKKLSIYGILAVGVVCLIFYVYLHIMYGVNQVQTPSVNGFVRVLSGGNTSPMPNEMRKKILELKKNIVDIEYFGKNDERPSKESFLGVLSDQSFLKYVNKNSSRVSSDLQKKKMPLSPVSTTPFKKSDLTIFQSLYHFTNTRKESNNRYLYILGHYEQLGKTVVNFVHASLLASHMNRQVVLPFVRNSRFCGLPKGWIGATRRKSREFLPMDNYFDMQSVEGMFHDSGFASIVQFSEFKDKCEGSSTMLYFIYAGLKVETKRYFQFSESEYSNMEMTLASSSGVMDCRNVEAKVKSSVRVENVSFNKAYCIDAERITKIKQLPETIKQAKCLTIFLWRGVGPSRTHFNATLPVDNYEHYLSQIRFSQSILSEADDFVRYNLRNEPFIGIQIRSERQLGWYGLAKFKHCLDLVVQVATIFVYKKKLKRIFVASDLEKHGSDQLASLLNATVLADAKDYFEKSFKNLNIKLYQANKRRGLVHNDAGYVALTQMEVLSRSRHLITLGAGTFQNWVKARFKKNKTNVENSNSWSITRVCSLENKRQKVPKKNVP